MVAEPGVGKSRLCHEFAERRRAEGVDVFAGHGLAHARSVPFLPVLEILRVQFGITEQDRPEAAREKVSRFVRDLAASVEDEALALLFEFLGIADPKRPATTIDPEARQRQIFAAVHQLGRARSTRNAFVVIVRGSPLARPREHCVPGELRGERGR